MNIFRCTECEGWLKYRTDHDIFCCPTCGHTEERDSEYIENIIEEIDPICPKCESRNIQPNCTERDADWFCSTCQSWFKQPALDWKPVVSVDVEVKL